MKTQTKIIAALETLNNRSAWDKGVNDYAIDLVNDSQCEGDITKAGLLNGARDWSEFSYGGCSLIYDADICEALCSPSEVKRSDSGRLAPNGRETWLDVQTRALNQAWNRIKRVIRTIEIKEAA